MNSQLNPLAQQPQVACATSYIDHTFLGIASTPSEKNRFTARLTAYAQYDQSLLLALSVVGAGTSLDAIRANIVMGRGVVLEIDLPEPVERRYGTGWSTLVTKESTTRQKLDTAGQRYVLYKNRLHERQDHYLIINRRVFEPRHDDDAHFFYAQANEPMSAFIVRALHRTLDVAVMPHWGEYLAQKNTNAGYTNAIALATGKGFPIYRIPVSDYWRKTISQGLKDGLIRFEEQI